MPSMSSMARSSQGLGRLRAWSRIISIGDPRLNVARESIALNPDYPRVLPRRLIAATVVSAFDRPIGIKVPRHAVPKWDCHPNVCEAELQL